VSGTTGLREVAAILRKKYGYVKPKQKMTARAVTEPLIGQMTQKKALATRLGEFYTTVWLVLGFEVL
jgi:hypothetical protein